MSMGQYRINIAYQVPEAIEGMVGKGEGYEKL